jgi:hypothetical protein
MSRTLRCPFITTVWPISDRADQVVTVRKIQDKFNQYHIISPKEQAYLDRFGKILQNKVFS